MKMSLSYTIEKGGLQVRASDRTEKMELEDLYDILRDVIKEVSTEALAEEQAAGFTKNPITLVDNSKNKPIENVSPFGKVEYLSPVTDAYEPIVQIYSWIQERSKIVTGMYKDHNLVLYNGKVVASNTQELSSWLDGLESAKTGDVIRFLNVTPYARRLERLGVTASRSKTRLVRSRDKRKRSGEFILGNNGVYHLSMRAAAAKYKNRVGFIGFQFVSGASIGLDKLPSSDKSGNSLRKGYVYKPRKQKAGPYIYPSIVMRF